MFTNLSNVRQSIVAAAAALVVATVAISAAVPVLPIA